MLYGGLMGYLAWKQPSRYADFSRRFLLTRFSPASERMIVASGRIGSILLFVFGLVIFAPLVYLLLVGAE